MHWYVYKYSYIVVNFVNRPSKSLAYLNNKNALEHKWRSTSIIICGGNIIWTAHTWIKNIETFLKTLSNPHMGLKPTKENVLIKYFNQLYRNTTIVTLWLYTTRSVTTTVDHKGQLCRLIFYVYLIMATCKKWFKFLLH